MQAIDISFGGLATVAAVALAAPLAFGIVIGRQVLGWVSIDTQIQVMSLLGLAFPLLLAGLEVEYERFRGHLLRLAAARSVNKEASTHGRVYLPLCG